VTCTSIIDNSFLDAKNALNLFDCKVFNKAHVGDPLLKIVRDMWLTTHTVESNSERARGKKECGERAAVSLKLVPFDGISAMKLMTLRNKNHNSVKF